MRLNGNLVLNSGGQGEIRNAVCERLASAPSFSASEAGRLYYNTTSNTYFINNGTVWVALATGGDASALQTEVDAIETSMGALLNGSGVFQASAFSGFNNVTTPTSLTNVLSQIDAAIEGVDSFAEMNDVAFGTLVDNDLLQYDTGTSKWVNIAIGSASGVQAYDTDLVAVAGLSSTGIAVRTGTGTWVTRALSAPAAGFTISDADGVSGSPTFVLANDLAALEGLASTGIAVRDNTDSWVQRTITGTAGNVTVSNGSGAAGNPTLDLASVSQGVGGSFLKVTLDGFGRVTQNTAVVTGDITALVDSTYVNVSGDTMSGALNMGSNQVTGLAAGTTATDAINKSQLDAAIAGLTWKNPAKAATTANVTLSGEQTVDSIALVTGDRILVKNQTASEDNGIYLVASGSWTRTIDMDSLTPIDEINSAAVFVQQGTINADYAFTVTSTVATLGTDPIVWAQFTGASAINAGIGLSQTGNTIDVKLGAGIAELPSDEVGIQIYSYTGSALAFADGGGSRIAVEASATTGDTLHLFLEGSTLTQSGSGLKIADNGVTATQIATSVAGDGLAGGGGTALSVNVDDSSIEINTDTLRVKALGITNAMLAGSIANAKLVNSKITITGDTGTQDLDLGDSLSVIGGTGIDTAVSATDTLTVTLNATIDDLSDVVITSAANDHVLTHNGTNWVNQKAYHLYTGSSATSHTVNHGLGQQYCNVTVIDSGNDEVVIPQSITFDDSNNLTVTFNAALACKVVVMGLA